MRLGTGGLLLAVLSCTPRAPTALSAAQLQSRATRSIPAAFDDVFDATWLTLETAGWAVLEHDRHAGTLSTRIVVSSDGTGRAWRATVSQEGARAVVQLLPRVYLGEREVTSQMHWTLEGAGGEVERWDGLFADVVGLIDIWRLPPELKLSNSRGELEAVGLRLLVPNWKHFEFSLDRRTLMMRGAGAGLVPTLIYRVERRRPRPDVAGLLSEMLEHAFHAPGRVTEPEVWTVVADSWGETAVGEVQIELTDRPVRWRRWEAGNPAWVVRVAAACPEEANDCEADVRRVIESAVNTAPVPGIRAR